MISFFSTALRSTSRLLLGLGTATIAMLAPLANAQTNLLVNADFETNAGFSFDAPNCQDFWGGFCGFTGWNTDFADDGEFNGSWLSDSPGGFRLANVFPAGGAPNDPVLNGDGSMLILGSFDSSVPSVLAQQVAVTPGQSIRGGIFAYSDSTRIQQNGFPDTIYGQFSRNRVRMRVEFFDAAGFGSFLEDTEVVIFDPANDPGFNFTTLRNPNFEDKWVEAVSVVTVPDFAAFARLAVIFDQVNNAGGLVFMDTASIVNLTAGAPATGDFNFDGVLNSNDLNMLQLAVSGDLDPGDNRFELTGDSVLNAADIAAWQALGGVPGDYNGDGSVDAADYTVWRDSLGSTTSLAADGSNNGVIDQADYGVWKTNFGSPATAAVTAAVPEPTGLLLAGVLLALGLATRRV